MFFTFMEYLRPWWVAEYFGLGRKCLPHLVAIVLLMEWSVGNDPRRYFGVDLEQREQCRLELERKLERGHADLQYQRRI